MLSRYIKIQLMVTTFFFLIFQQKEVSSLATFPGLNQESYGSTGDINIGSLISATISLANQSIQCSKNVTTNLDNIQYMEAISFAVRKINEDSKLLPNITFGFRILDNCQGLNLALAQSLAFLPRQKIVCPLQNCDSSDYSIANTTNSSACSDSGQPGVSHIGHYDVIGVLSPTSSFTSAPISQMYSVARQPMISYRATSDDLSDKQRHPYFLRVVPPDQIQVLAMLRFIADRNWSYISVIYSDRTYGQNGFDRITKSAPDFGICIATSHALSDDLNFDDVVNDLSNHPKARAVIVFTGSRYAVELFNATRRANQTGMFVWMGSDGWGSSIITNKEVREELIGAFTFMYNSKYVPEFFSYLSNLNINESSNVWLRAFFEAQDQCSFQAGTCSTNISFTELENFIYYNGTSLAMDCVYTIAHAAHELIKDHCPGIQGKEARECITGELLKEYMFKSSFDGYTGKISFDQNGDMVGMYQIGQIVPEGLGDSSLRVVPVGFYSTHTKIIEYTDFNITWSHVLPKERILTTENGHNITDVPESVCSRPCVLGESKLLKEQTCCWECRKCRENEKLVKNNTECKPCEKFTWPDPESNFTNCSSIPLSYPSMSDTLPVIQICLGFLGIIALSGVVSTYIYRRHDRVIKAASRELSILQMTAIFVGYLTVIIMQTPPTHEICGVCYFLFCLSFAWLYSPLIVKTVRIYRIFKSSAHNKRPRYVSPRSQIIMATLLIAVQVVLCVVTYTLYTPTAIKTQNVDTEKFVELSCDMTFEGLLSFLTYNLVLVSLCSVFAFKARKLPDNFNESRFISMCVSTTLVIWIAFIPTYFTAALNSVRILLLSLALLLNHTVALVFLFLPKIYAALYVPSENILATRFHTNALSVPSKSNGATNRVAPLSLSKPRIFPE